MNNTHYDAYPASGVWAPALTPLDKELAIDHVRVGSAFESRGARVLPALGVDHYPLVVDIIEARGLASIELPPPPTERRLGER